MLEFYRSKEHEDGRRGKSQSFKRMNHRFMAFIKTEHDLKLLRQFEKSGVYFMLPLPFDDDDTWPLGQIPTERSSAMRQLASDVKAKLDEKIKKGVPIHDSDIRKMALDINKLTGASSTFKVSSFTIFQITNTANLIG